MAVVSMSYLLESGVHFGHQTKRWNPKMKEYIYTSRDDIYIIDLQKTAKMVEEAYNALYKIAEEGGKVIFVGTRKQASEAIKEEAIRSNSYYVNTRWLGGTLTNFKTIRRRIKRLEEIEKMEKDGTFEVLPKKEVFKIKKEYDKLNELLCGIREMHKLPSAMFIVDPSKEDIAIKEARKLKIPVFGIVDTNCDPDMVDYVIPGNDDAIRAVKLITAVMANAVCAASGLKTIEFGTDEDNATEIMQKALETVKKKERRPFNNDRNNNRPRYNDRNGDRNNFRREDRKPFERRENVAAKEEVKQEVKAEVKPVEKAVEKADLTTLTVNELREMAKAKEVKGYSTMKKSELLDALK